jgi:hypothetical protein
LVLSYQLVFGIMNSSIIVKKWQFGSLIQWGIILGYRNIDDTYLFKDYTCVLNYSNVNVWVKK